MLTRTLKLGLAALLGVASVLPGVASAQYYRAPPGYDRGGYDRAIPPPPPRYVDHDEGRVYPSRPPNRCRNNGTGGTILGAIAGGLLGNSVAGRGDRGAGTVIGAGIGALGGRAIDRDC